MTAYRTAKIDWSRSTHGNLYYLHGCTGEEYVRPDHMYRSTGATRARKRAAVRVAKRSPPPGWRYGQARLPSKRGELTVSDAGPWYNGSSACVQLMCSCGQVVYVPYRTWMAQEMSCNPPERCVACAREKRKLLHAERVTR